MVWKIKNKNIALYRFFVFTLTFALLIGGSVNVLAAEDEGDNNRGVSITVVVPNHSENQTQPQDSQSDLPAVYPVSVWETRDSGRREIIRVYELMPNEHSSQIPRDSFERDGFRFELAEITRREMPVYSMREHAETIEVSTQSNDLETIIRLLSPTLEFVTEDGYFGVLVLDVSSIRIESQGTRSNSFTQTRTREFPHLASSDTSLVPRTITENGGTYNLTDVQWRTQSTDAVDYTQVPSRFTAVATYSRTATSTTTIGYTTTAEYRGQISRISAGRTEFTAQFIGIPIVTGVMTLDQFSADTEVLADGNLEDAQGASSTSVPESASSDGTTIIDHMNVEQVHIGGIVIEMEREADGTDRAINGYVDSEHDLVTESQSMRLSFNALFLAVLFVGAIAFAYFVGKKGKRMFGIMKKIACLAFAVSMIYCIPHTVYGASLPRYNFGAQQMADSTRSISLQDIHINYASVSNATDQSIAADTSTRSLHFDPRVAGGSSWGGSTTHLISDHFRYGIVSSLSYGDRIGLLTVERLGRNVNVIAGATMEAMDFGAGHFSFTGLNYGNTGLIGHNRGRTNGFFSFVRELQEGDILTLETGGTTRSYVVSMLYTVDAYDFGALMQFGDNRLTLVTCVEYRPNQRRIAVAFEA